MGVDTAMTEARLRRHCESFWGFEPSDDEETEHGAGAQTVNRENYEGNSFVSNDQISKSSQQLGSEAHAASHPNQNQNTDRTTTVQDAPSQKRVNAETNAQLKAQRKAFMSGKIHDIFGEGAKENDQRPKVSRDIDTDSARFNGIIREINDMAYPHLDKGKQIMHQHAKMRALGLSVEKTHAPLPVIKRAREAERRKAEERKALEDELGVQLQAGHITYVPQLEKQRRKRLRIKESSKKRADVTMGSQKGGVFHVSKRLVKKFKS